MRLSIILVLLLLLASPARAQLSSGGGGAVTVSPGVTSVACTSPLTCSPPTGAATLTLSGAISAANMLPLTLGSWYVGALGAVPTTSTPTAALDSAFGSAQGNLLCRGASAWAVLAPSANTNYVLTETTPNACPTWASPTAVLPTLTVTLEASNFNGSSATVYYGINAASLTDTLPNPGTNAGAVFQGFDYDNAHQYTLTTTGGSATILGPNVSGTSLTMPIGSSYNCVDATTYYSCQIQYSNPQIPASLGWTAGLNPTQTLILADIPRAITLTSVVCRPEVAVGTAATISVFIAASGTAIGSGTNVSSGTCNANGTAATNQSLTLTTTAVPAGDSIGITTTNGSNWTAGSGIGTITVYYQEQ